MPLGPSQEPLVVEADGGFGKEARSVLGALATAAGRLTGEGTAVRGEMAVQSLSVALQRANAAAIARRAPDPAPPLAAPLAAAQSQLRFAAARDGCVVVAAALPPARTAATPDATSPPPLCDTTHAGAPAPPMPLPPATPAPFRRHSCRSAC